MNSWQRILTFVEGRVSKQDFTNWFKPTQFKDLHGDNTLLVSVPNLVFEDWLNGYPSTVTLTLSDINSGTQSTVVTSWDGIDSNYLYFNVQYIKLKDHTFTLYATYNSIYSGLSYGPVTIFYDPNNVGMGSIQMPYSNPGDSTGHSVNLYMYF